MYHFLATQNFFLALSEIGMRIMRHELRNRPGRRGLQAALTLLVLAGAAAMLSAHIVPAERLHPVAESYRRLAFLLDLNPVPWVEVQRDAGTLAEHLQDAAVEEGQAFHSEIGRLVKLGSIGDEGEPVEPQVRRAAARALFERSTRAVATTLNRHLERARLTLDDPVASARSLEEARQVWSAFEPVIRSADPEAFVRLGECWLELTGALGRSGVLGVGE